MAEKLGAHYDNRTYFFYITSQKEDELIIDMYNTPFVFLRKDGVWQNSAGNRQQMVQPLIDVVVATVGL